MCDDASVGAISTRPPPSSRARFPASTARRNTLCGLSSLPAASATPMLALTSATPATSTDGCDTPSATRWLSASAAARSGTSRHTSTKRSWLTCATTSRGRVSVRRRCVIDSTSSTPARRRSGRTPTRDCRSHRHDRDATHLDVAVGEPDPQPIEVEHRDTRRVRPIGGPAVGAPVARSRRDASRRTSSGNDHLRDLDRLEQLAHECRGTRRGSRRGPPRWSRRRRRSVPPQRPRGATGSPA